MISFVVATNVRLHGPKSCRGYRVPASRQAEFQNGSQPLRAAILTICILFSHYAVNTLPSLYEEALAASGSVAQPNSLAALPQV